MIVAQYGTRRAEQETVTHRIRRAENDTIVGQPRDIAIVMHGKPSFETL